MDSIRALIPYVRPLRNINKDRFPYAFCDIVTANIWIVHQVPGYEPRCGEVEGVWHFWVKFGDTNIDFTAHQFPSLIKHVVVVDGFDVVYGSDSYFKSIGYVFYHNDRCPEQLRAAADSIIYGEYGDCAGTACYLD